MAMKDKKHITAQVNFRPAEREDLSVSPKYTMRYGQAYAVANNDGATLSGMHVITLDTDAHELASWYKQGRVYVPVASIDNPITMIKNDNNDANS